MREPLPMGNMSNKGIIIDRNFDEGTMINKNLTNHDPHVPSLVGFHVLTLLSSSCSFIGHSSLTKEL